MTVVIERTPAAMPALSAALLAGSTALFVAALLGDIAYWYSHEIQWSNFASWQIAGALLLAAVALVFALIGVARSHGHRRWLYVLVLLGFINALVHARDAWAIMPAALVLSVVVTLLALIVTWIGFATLYAGDAP
jgi:uncharacterized membrane protein